MNTASMESPCGVNSPASISVFFLLLSITTHDASNSCSLLAQLFSSALSHNGFPAPRRDALNASLFVRLSPVCRLHPGGGAEGERSAHPGGAAADG